MARRKENKEKRKSKNVLTEFNSDEVPGHKFEDVDTVLQVLTPVGYSNVILIFCRALGSEKGRQRRKRGTRRRRRTSLRLLVIMMQMRKRLKDLGARAVRQRILSRRRRRG